MFKRGSRYEKTDNYLYASSDGTKYLVKKIRKVPDDDSKVFHIVKQGDRLDIMAFIYYDDPTKFWIISDSNKEMYPDDALIRGNRIAIPPERF